MNILALDASGIAGSVAYYKKNKLVGEYYICDGLTHSQTIMPMLENMKSLLSIDLKEIELVAVTSGPGSFTGLRIGVATAKAMAMALNLPIIGIPTLDVLAANISFTPYIICPIMDARRGQVYTAQYRWNETSHEMQRISEYEAIELNILLNRLINYSEKVVFTGDGIDVFKDTIIEVLKDRALFAKPSQILQRASVLADLAFMAYQRGESMNADNFIPMYLRKSQAEREREERLAHEN
jgi:tRNA threonylcarbamoyladenosine biosynthesis protein TsaB